MVSRHFVKDLRAHEIPMMAHKGSSDSSSQKSAIATSGSTED